MKGIEHKIKEIRRQPEHIRLRYVWGSVVVCMVAIIVIWFLSIKVNFMDLDGSVGEATNDTKNQFDILDSTQEQTTTGSFDGEMRDESTSIDKLLEEAREYEESQGMSEGIVESICVI